MARCHVQTVPMQVASAYIADGFRPEHSSRASNPPTTYLMRLISLLVGVQERSCCAHWCVTTPAPLEFGRTGCSACAVLHTWDVRDELVAGRQELQARDEVWQSSSLGKLLESTMFAQSFLLWCSAVLVGLDARASMRCSMRPLGLLPGWRLRSDAVVGQTKLSR